MKNEGNLITDWLDQYGDPEIERFVEKKLAITEKVRLAPEQKLLEIQKLLSEVVGEFEIRTLRVLNIDKPFSRTLDDNARSIRELHRGLHTSGQLDTWITNLRRADKLTNENEQCNHKFERVEKGGEFQGNQCDCGEWEDLT